MGKRSRQTFQKHQKEQARQQKQHAKVARRLQAKQRRSQDVTGMGELSQKMADRPPVPQHTPALGDHVSEPT
jgi:hypothetical protein